MFLGSQISQWASNIVIVPKKKGKREKVKNKRKEKRKGGEERVAIVWTLGT